MRPIPPRTGPVFMPPQAVQAGIRFGNSNPPRNVLSPLTEYLFSEPCDLATWKPPAESGIYVILVPDEVCKPRPFREIYFGQTKDCSERGFPDSHHKSLDWKLVARGRRLFVAVHLMPRSTEPQRCAVETELCAAYKPRCNG
jgi:hypothetical protein